MRIDVYHHNADDHKLDKIIQMLCELKKEGIDPAKIQEQTDRLNVAGDKLKEAIDKNTPST